MSIIIFLVYVMLQIISGKFFKSDFRQTRSAKGILYSNYSWVGSIQTCIATIEPVDTFGSSICSYIVNYENQIEDEPQPGALAPTGDWEIIRQFQLLCTFGLKAAFDLDRTSIELNCREKRKHSGDQYLPSRFTTRFFNPVIKGNNNEVQRFVQFVDKVIALPRKEYLAVIRCLTNFSDALQALNFNLDLAYSMLIYSLEALSQNFDGYNPIWQDYPQREEMDKLLLQIDQDLADNIRNLLIKDRHLKLTKRFVDFIISYIESSIKDSSKEYQIPMLSLHRLFCCLTNNYERHYQLETRFSDLIKECHIELMVVGLIFSPTISWKLHECVEIYETYSKKRFHKNMIHIPRLIEIFLIIEIANIALKEKQVEIYQTWLNNACLEASGIPAIQNAIKNSMTQTEQIQLDDLLKLLKQPS